MSSDPAITIDGLGKRYRIVPFDETQITAREALMRRARHPLRRTQREWFWALRNVSFDVAEGEVVGIIGRNGAGKSTLLKLLSRITDPSEGEAIMRGRTGSLLEVGTGFNPELTGRENVFLNGSILGMSRKETQARFDEIVEFSGVAKFLDTQVKRYSSGMTVRLAFAVAAHLEPEILIIDEVLAVGDAEFQQKCIRKLDQVANEDARTVLFVSHNLASVEALCTRCVYLADGEVVFDGAPDDAIARYLYRVDSTETAAGRFDLRDRANHWSDQLVVTEMELQTLDGLMVDTMRMGEGLRVVVTAEGLADAHQPVVSLQVRSEIGHVLTTVTTHMDPPVRPAVATEREQYVCELPSLPLLEGTYSIDVTVFDGPKNRIDKVERAASFTVTEADVFGGGYRMRRKDGVFFVPPRWSVRSAEESVPTTEVPDRV